MKTLIFDFDGTLADSFELVADIAHELTGIPPIDDAEIARLRRLPLTKVIKELKIPFYRLPRLLITGRQKMTERIAEVLPFPGIPEVLSALHKDGHHILLISSNSEQNVRAFLRANDFEQYFDGVYGGVGIFDKSSALRKVMRRNRLDPANCYYIGDEVRDIVGATKVNVRAVSVTWGYQDREVLKEHNPYVLIDVPTDLVGLFSPNKV